MKRFSNILASTLLLVSVLGLIATTAQAQLTTGGITIWGIDGARESAASAALPVSIAAGHHQSYAIRKDGTFVSWGYGGLKQNRWPSDLRYVKQIATNGDNNSESFTVALKQDGTVVAWGNDSNNVGTLNVPPGLSNVTQVAAGAYHALALRSDGTVSAWGYNGYGQCSTDVWTGIKQVAAGWIHSVGLRTNGTVVCIGDNSNGECNVPTGLKGVVQVAAGYYFTLALKSDGTVVGWGYNGHGDVTGGAGHTRIVSLSTDWFSTIALKSDGTVAAWGDNSYGSSNVPVGLSNVVQIAKGGYFSVALQANGNIVCWGRNDVNQSEPPYGWQGAYQIALGGRDNHAERFADILKADGTLVTRGYFPDGYIPLPIGTSPVKQVSAGTYHSAALKPDGTLVFWGNNGYGQCNIPTGLGSVAQVSAGYIGTVALLSDGTVQAWGYTGNGATNVPSGLSNVTQVFSGYEANFAIKSDGTVVAWGYPGNGQIDIPSGLTNVVQVVNSYTTSMALKSDGSIVGWGWDGYGKLSGGLGVTGLTQIGMAFAHVVGLRTDGTFVGWGNNDWGQITGVEGVPQSAYIAAGNGSSALIPAVNVWINQGSLSSDAPATGTITLTKAAGVGGVDVALSSDNAAVTVPDTVHIDEGSRTATFSLTASDVSTETVAAITATLGTATNVAVVTDTPLTPTLITLSTTANTFTGGSATVVTGTLKLSSIVNTDTDITITSTSPNVTVGTVTVKAGYDTAWFPIAHSVVSADTLVKLSASLNGASKSVSLTDKALTVTAIGITPQWLAGGSTAKLTVTLSDEVADDTLVSLASSNSAVTVLAALKIAATTAKSTITVSTLPVSDITTASLTATYNGTHLQTALTVNPPQLKSFKLPSPLFALTKANAIITFNDPTPADGVISLTSSSSALVVPATVTIPQGMTSITFPFTTGDPTVQTDCVVTATYKGSSIAVVCSVKPNPLTDLKVSPATVKGGSDTVVNGTVTLLQPVAVDTSVTLTSDTTSAAEVPATVTILAGQKTATFSVTHHAVSANTAVSLIASRNGVSLSKTLTVAPLLKSVKIPPTLYGIGTGTGTVTLNITAPRRLGCLFSL